MSSQSNSFEHRIFILSGSHQQAGNSHRVADYLKEVLSVEYQVAQTDVFKVTEQMLPLWTPEIGKQDGPHQDILKTYRPKLAQATALIVVSPEYHGMVPAGVKNFFLYFGNAELADKAGLIVAVSASRGGAYPVSELRQSSYKNSYLCYIPEHIIVRHAGQMLQGDEPANDEDAYLRGRMRHGLSLLLAYGEALAHVRKSGARDLKAYPNGM